MTRTPPRLEAASDADPARKLLLWGDSGWRHAVDAELSVLGREGTLVLAESAPDAMVRLAMAPEKFSHVLVQSDAAGDLLGEMLGLTARAPGPAPAMVLLGAASPQQPTSPVAIVDEAPAPGWLARALAWQPPGHGKQHRMLGDDDAREALAGDAVRVLYQPMVWLGDSQPGGMEALARMEHPVWGRLAPAQFLPAVEHAGLLMDLTRAVVERAFSQWDADRLRKLGMGIGINLPLDILLLPELTNWLETRCAAANLTPFHIVLELTETQPVLDVPALGAAVTALRGRGYRLAIDDVGPGQRDPTALLRLPFTSLKLDIAVVHEAVRSPGARGYLRRIAGQAHDAGMIVVAEGIENADIWARMRELGADAGQGYGIARPLPAVAVPLWHRAWTAALRAGQDPSRVT